MRFGKVQKDLMRWVEECHPRGAYIYNRSAGFSGYDEKQILKAADALIKRNILKKGCFGFYHKVKNEDHNPR